MIALNDTCVTRHQGTGQAICSALRAEALKLGLAAQGLPAMAWSALQFTIRQDPADGSDCLTGEWRDAAGHRIGQIQFNGDGSFFAEHDLAQPHPGDPRWFIEAVEAWGRQGRITTDARLLVAV